MEGSPKPVSWWARGSHPIWLLVAFWSLVTLGAAPVIVSWAESEFMIVELLLNVHEGSQLGMLLLVGLLSALRWRSWAGGYVAGIALVSSGHLVIWAGWWLADHADSEELLRLSLFPALLLSLTLPLIACRYLLGWRLVAGDEDVPPRETFRLGDLFALTAVAAANLVLTRLPHLFIPDEDVSDFVTSLWSDCAAACGIGLVVLPLCVRLAFGTRTRLVAGAGLVLLAGLVPVGSYGITCVTHLREASWEDHREAILVILAVSGAATVTLYAAMFFLARCGMSLVRTIQLPHPQSVPATFRSSGWLAAGSIQVAFLAALIIVRVDYEWRAAEREIKRLDTLARQLDGWITVDDGRIFEIRLGARATDSDLKQFLPCAIARSIELVNSQITDAGVAQLRNFPRTRFLRLDGTQVTDAGLATLSALNQLEHLDLSDTKVTGNGIATYITNPSLRWLRLDNTQFDDAGCRALRRFPKLEILSLAGTQVTNQGVECLSELKDLHSLDLSRTAVTPDGLPELAPLFSLYLGGTKTDDASISRIANIRSLVTLDLRQTAITDVGLEQLGTLPELRHLSLADTAVTGDGFRSWSEYRPFGTLSLARTACHDGAIEYLARFSQIEELDLSETPLGDAVLAGLDQSRIRSLYLGGTRITATGLLAAGMSRVSALHILPGQFTDAEYQQFQVRRPEWVRSWPANVSAERHLHGSLPR